MCVSAAVIAGASLAVAAAGTAVTIDNANYSAKMMEFQLAEQREGLRAQMEMSRLQAQEAEAARLAEFRRQRAANLAAMGADGWGQHMSFLQGIAPAEEKALRFDLANIRAGDLGTRSRLSSEIRVNRMDSKMNAANRSARVMGSLIDFAGSAASAGDYYRKNS